MTYKQQFIKFMVDNGVLKFGEFTLKSGRKAPYFINTGNYKSGAQLGKLGEYYAQCIVDNGIKADTLVGPAYKGIPLAVTTAVSLYGKHGIDMDYCFDRKELKASADVEIAGMVISVDRMERGLESGLSAVQEVYKEFGVKVYSIVTMSDIIGAIEDGIIEGREYLPQMLEYRKTYGVE